jgi:signal transduction histidine kinase
MSNVTASESSQITNSERRDYLLDSNGGEYLAVELASRAVQRLSVLGEMTGGIAHDFRNILSIIDSSLRLIAKNPHDPEKLDAFIAGAQDGLQKGLRLTSRLLSFAKQRELEPQPVDANVLLKSLELFLKYGVGYGIRIGFELTSDIPKCLIDPPQFNAAILNLVINARDAMPHGGEIRISTAHRKVYEASLDLPFPAGYVQVRVIDNGLGMSAEVIRNLFQPFFTTKGENGTGLGLPQVHALMHQAGGRVAVSSELGHGTTVDLLFPALASDGLAAQPSQS